MPAAGAARQPNPDRRTANGSDPVNEKTAETTGPPAETRVKNRRPAVRRLLRGLERLLALLGLFFVIYHLAFEISAMTSDSMTPTLKGTNYENGDRVLLEKVTGWLRAPRRWEVYFFYNVEGTPVAKRIVGLPGERISVTNSTLYVNGSALQLPERLKFLKYLAAGNLAAGREVHCGTGYYVLGDDSHDSYDSRFVGPVERTDFRGRAWCIISPRSRVGWVH